MHRDFLIIAGGKYEKNNSGIYRPYGLECLCDAKCNDCFCQPAQFL